MKKLYGAYHSKSHNEYIAYFYLPNGKPKYVGFYPTKEEAEHAAGVGYRKHLIGRETKLREEVRA
jgi:hypothetical protein